MFKFIAKNIVNNDWAFPYDDHRPVVLVTSALNSDIQHVCAHQCCFYSNIFLSCRIAVFAPHPPLIPDTVFWLSLTLSRSLILCHSKTTDDCPSPEDRHAGEVSEGHRTWGPGWRTDLTAGDRTGNRDAENGQWKRSAMEQRGGTDAANQTHHTTTLRENKKSIRRSFSIKVRLQDFALGQNLCIHFYFFPQKKQSLTTFRLIFAV